MGLFSQPFNRGGSSIRPATPKFTKGLFDNDDVLLLAPVKGSESFSLDCNKVKRHRLPQRFWNIMQTQNETTSANINLQAMSVLDSDTDRSMSPVDEWENESDHVNLLPQKTATIVRSAINPSKGKELDVKLTTSAGLEVSPSSGFPLRKHTSELLATNGTRSHKNLNRSFSTRSGKNSNKSKQCRKEIEIQFECFLEDDEDSCAGSHLPSFSTFPNFSPPMLEKNSVKPTVTRSVQSWFTQTLGAVKKGCMIPVNPKFRKPSKPQERNATESSDDCDAESQVQIIFERTNVCECTDEYMFAGSNSIEDDVTISFSQNQLWGNEAPIQFLIPNIAIKSVYSWDYNETSHLTYDDQLGSTNGFKPVLVPIV
jgi:hypothetical protein